MRGSTATVESTKDSPEVDLDTVEKYDRASAASELEMSLRTLERLMQRNEIGYVKYRGRVYVTRAQLDEYRARETTWIQPTLPGFERGVPPFTEANAAQAARILDGINARRARASTKDDPQSEVPKAPRRRASPRR